MKAFIASLLFLALLGIRAPASFAQTDQSYQKLAQEMETLKTELSALQSQLQTVENVEKIDLMAKLADAQAKLTDANAKLMNVEFEKFDSELTDSNDKWLWTWVQRFVGIISISVLIMGGAFLLLVRSSIAKGIEKNLSGFKDGLAQADTLKNEFNEVVNKIRVLNKEHAAKVVESSRHFPLDDEDSYSEQVKKLSEEALIDVLRDETYHPNLTYKTGVILVRRQPSQFAFLALEILNSTLDSHQDKELGWYTENRLRKLVSLLSLTRTQETYEGLIKFLNRTLLRENKEFKDPLLADTAFSIALVSRELNKEDWLSELKTSISQLDNDPETIKGILQHRLLYNMPNVDDFKDYLLDLLDIHEPELVNNFREQKANANTETEAN